MLKSGYHYVRKKDLYHQQIEQNHKDWEGDIYHYYSLKRIRDQGLTPEVHHTEFPYKRMKHH